MTDAHCHPWDLRNSLEKTRSGLGEEAEKERRKTGTAAAASSTSREEFEYHEDLAKKAREEGAPPLFCCFALHPQLSPVFLENPDSRGYSLSEGLELLETLAGEGRLDGVGETGFDLFNGHFKAAEKIQDDIFASHLDIALKYRLPLIIHARRAMHKIFPFSGKIKKLPAVIFHSWPGSRGEGKALLGRGINVFFSFGTTVLKNHKEAMASAAVFPPEHLLLESDAPWQPLRGEEFSSWQDLDLICSAIAGLRKEAGSPCNTREELELATTENFFGIFSK